MARASAPRAFLLAAGLLLGIEDVGVAQTQPAPNGFALLGLESVRLGSKVRVQPGAVGATGGRVQLAAGTVVPGSVVADSVRVARHARVGRLFCRVASGGAFGPGVVGGPAVGGAPIPGCLELTVPVVDPALLAPVTVAPGSSDLAIPARTGSAPVAAGAFGAVTVGRGSLLQLAGGAYQMRSIRVAAAARLVCLDACRIGVAESVRIGARAQLGAAQGLRPDRARLDVGAGDVAFRSGPRAVVAATIFAPAGSVVLGPGGEYRGAYVGRSVAVRRRSRVIEMSGLVPPV